MRHALWKMSHVSICERFAYKIEVLRNLNTLGFLEQVTILFT